MSNTHHHHSPVEPEVRSLPVDPGLSVAMPKSRNTGQDAVGVVFKEYPFYEPLLMRNHPSKVYVVAYGLYPMGGDMVRPEVISVALVEKSIVN